MEYIGASVTMMMETAGMFAPLIFIALHLLRPLLFLPVVFLCITGGLLFGIVPGIIYSLIGITLSSLTFYKMTEIMPSTLQRFFRMKQKLLGKQRDLTTLQIALLRLIPFIHFHLLSLCILELSRQLKDYMRASFISNIPLAVVYTSIGESITNFSPIMAGSMMVGVLPILYFVRRKEIYISWQDFFHPETTNSDVI
ncbi:SNARE associated Golgi protein [Paraliobacillus sp. PM-2]|uniref:TVP38/TMEM64 family protein n=1 Tax=Paraliobacillus sp. PM-2 TaxID=1462524 RepID=UPI00061C1472|nr:VTT domain-containing protein [Paraliobacillus sp. PM-2]CQR48089.1 SNARE associated Golgi protein [Paraliobacillus sp. PM-2]